MNFGGIEFFAKNAYTNNFPAFEAAYGMKKKVDPDEKEKKPELMDSLFASMKGYLVFGRVLGVIPVSGVLQSAPNSLVFKIFSFPVLLSISYSIIVGLSVAMGMIQTIRLTKSNALEIARSVQGTAFLIWGLFGYVYFLLRSNFFINILKTWGKSTLYFSVKDKMLHRDIILVSSIIFISATVENTIYHFEFFPGIDHINRFSNSTNHTKYPTSLETYYWRSSEHWGRYLGYHPILAILAFIAHNFALACWNYVDVLMIIFARALSFKFKELCVVAEESLSVTKPGEMSDHMHWVHIVKDHDTLCTLLETFERFLSPLIFGSYATNIYYVCMQLIDGLTPSSTGSNLVNSIFAPWSFLHLIMRIFLLSMAAARINTYAHQLGNILKKCPIDLYDSEVARVDKHLTAGPDIGLSGLGCFIVTKPFILSIVNVIFTVEIVLLQGLSSSTGSCATSSPS